jgi:predicted nucleotide-binding protein
MVPPDQLKSELADRLACGQELLDQPVNDLVGFEARQNDYYTWYDYNKALLERSFDSRQLANEYQHVGIGWPTDRPVQQRWEWLHQDISSDMRKLGSLQGRLGLFQVHSDVGARAVQSTGSSAAGTQIFIVHGHDGEAKQTAARFLATLLGQQPVILHEQPDRGRTIIEKFEYYAAQASCAVVLLTADDTGGPVAGNQQPRARQNVVLELGFFLGKLGRDRVIILYEPGVELPSDIHGVLYTELDRTGAWRNAVARELQGIGLEVDTQALLA